MAAPPLRKILTAHRLIALDSCVLIYHLEQHERFGRAAEQVLSHVQRGTADAVLSTLALLEVQVGPYRKDAEDQAELYFALLGQLSHCRWAAVTYAIADRAAQLRAAYAIATPDAIHLATALENEATLFVTNDRSLPKLPDLDYLMLDEL